MAVRMTSFLLTVLQVASCQSHYGDSGDASVLANLSSTPGSGAVCVPVPKTYPNLTGDALYRQILLDFAIADTALIAAGAAKFNTTPITNSSGFFLMQVLNVYRNTAITLENLLVNSSSVSPSDCLTFNQLEGVSIRQTQLHASDSIPGGSCDDFAKATEGEGHYQYLLQQTGATITTLEAVGTGDSYSVPGKYQSIIHQINRAVNRVQAVVDNQDNSNECILATQELGEAFAAELTVLQPGS